MTDLISRHDAIDALSYCQTYLFDSRDDDKKISLEDAEYAIEQLPSAQPEQKQGKWCWVPTEGCFCTVCGRRIPEISDMMPNYCPNCGARMDKGDES